MNIIFGSSKLWKSASSATPGVCTARKVIGFYMLVIRLVKFVLRRGEILFFEQFHRCRARFTNPQNWRRLKMYPQEGVMLLWFNRLNCASTPHRKITRTNLKMRFLHCFLGRFGNAACVFSHHSFKM